MNNRGSEWRKWDLHIHTKGTNKNDQFSSSSMEDFLYIFFKKAIEKNISAIGVTDYFSIDRYNDVVNYQTNIEQKKDNQGQELFNEEERDFIKKIFIFPNIELRMLPSTDKGRLINIHFIFNPKLVTKLENDFFGELKNQDGFKMNKQGIIDYGKSLNSGITEDCLVYKEGIKKFALDVKTIKDLLDKNLEIKENSIVVVSNSSNDGASGLQKHYDLFENEEGGLDGVRKTIYKISNAIFSANPKDIKFFLGRKSQDTDGYTDDIYLREIEEVIDKVGSLKPCLVGCDAHKEDELFSKFTWIKADPTFEGLKQIIYEPEERVKIQEHNPELDYDKPFFSSIKFRDDEKIFSNDELYFDKSTQEIPLNPNLVTIIGGRGEGKSMLMKYISTSFEIKTIEKYDNFLKNKNIEVIYSKTIKNKEEIESFPIIKNLKHALDFIYISQGELKNIVENKKLAEAISEMANIRKITFDQDLNEEISDKLDELHSLKNFLDNPQNNLEKLQQRENTQQQFISNITTKENEEKLEQYSEILKQINIETNKKNQLSNFKQSLIQKSNELNQNINSLNENYGFGIPIIEVEQIFVSQLDKIHELITAIDNQLGLLNERKEAIKTEFSEFYTGDLTTLLRDVDKYQNELSIIQTQIKDVNEKKIKKENLQKEIFEGADTQKSLISKIEDEYKKQKEWILEDWNKFKNIEERESLNLQQKKIMQSLLQDLDIEVKIDFDKEAFYGEIYRCINGTEWRVKNNQKAQENYFGVNNLETFFKLIKEKYIEAYYANGIYGDTLKEILFDEEIRGKYIKVYPILKYKGKDINKLSVGQKGTMYLKMKLATEAFSKPIIFDQPEDDLDNQFIIKELVDLFKDLKKYRQIIIITHNANLVVNADAEQIVVARNNNEKLSYLSGSLENPEVNKHICEILEGGVQAFKNREKKYGFNTRL